MSGGAKIFWAFLGGTITGAVGLAYLNRNRLDFSYMKPITTDCLARGLNLKDQMMRKIAAVKEDFEDMAAEARDRVNEENMAENNDQGVQTK
ncbi:MAG: hypothetical protein K2H64_05285 [Desulfovibrio sp.]|nr:hypothetical protein [Desulfovibrio sp.]